MLMLIQFKFDWNWLTFLNPNLLSCSICFKFIALQVYFKERRRDVRYKFSNTHSYEFKICVRLCTHNIPYRMEHPEWKECFQRILLESL